MLAHLAFMKLETQPTEPDSPHPEINICCCRDFNNMIRKYVKKRSIIINTVTICGFRTNFGFLNVQHDNV